MFSIRPEVLVIFETDLDARRLAATWPAIGVVPEDRESVLLVWSEVSGLPIATVRRLEPVLRRNAICGADNDRTPFLDETVSMHLRELAVLAVRER